MQVVRMQVLSLFTNQYCNSRQQTLLRSGKWLHLVNETGLKHQMCSQSSAQIWSSVIMSVLTLTVEVCRFFNTVHTFECTTATWWMVEKQQ